MAIPRPLGEGSDATLYSYVSNNPVDAIDPLGLWQFSVSAGWGIAGSITFGNNGGSGLFNGNWNVGATLGVGAVASIKLDPSNKNPNQPQHDPCPGSGGPSFKVGVTANVGLGGGKIATAGLNGFAGYTGNSNVSNYGGSLTGNLNASIGGYGASTGGTLSGGAYTSANGSGGYTSSSVNGPSYTVGGGVLAGVTVGVSQ